MAASISYTDENDVADATVNADKAEMVGKAIIVTMQGQTVKEFKFCKKQQAVTMDVKTCAKVDGDYHSAGEKALVCLYNGRTGDTLDSLRYQRFHEKVSSCATSVQIQSLPPTTAAAKYHSLRVYLQVQCKGFGCSNSPTFHELDDFDLADIPDADIHVNMDCA
ncbi:hypothetical protein ACOMHN_016233 [Nucella lapillus]